MLIKSNSLARKLIGVRGIAEGAASTPGAPVPVSGRIIRIRLMSAR